MANPNLLTISSIIGNTEYSALTDTDITILSNPIGSNKVYKINTIRATNVHGMNPGDITVTVEGAFIAKTIPIPADAALEVMTKDGYFYLTEGQSIAGSANAADYVQLQISYEEMA